MLFFDMLVKLLIVDYLCITCFFHKITLVFIVQSRMFFFSYFWAGWSKHEDFQNEGYKLGADHRRQPILIRVVSYPLVN